jgi:hypothetical protein
VLDGVSCYLSALVALPSVKEYSVPTEEEEKEAGWVSVQIRTPSLCPLENIIRMMNWRRLRGWER